MVKKAIVLGGHVQGLGIVRILGKIGYEVTLLDQINYNIGRHSKYCHAFFKVGNEDVISYLMSENGINLHQGSIIFPTHDQHVEILSQNLKKLSKYYRPAVENWNVVEFCFNKRNTYRVAREAKISIPETYFPENLDDVQKLASELNYSCIIKPAVMYKFFNSFRQKVFVCANRDELISYYKRALEVIPEDEIIIQEIIPGASDHQYSVGCLYNNDHPIVTIAVRRRRQHPINFGNATTYAETVLEPVIVEAAYKLLSKIRYKGICEIEFKKDSRDGKFKLLEINPRTWKWHSISENAKTPFIEKYVQLLNDQIPEVRNEWDRASWSHYITDIPTMIQMKMRGMYSKADENPTKQAVFDMKDIKPAIFELLYLPYLIKLRG